MVPATRPEKSNGKSTAKEFPLLVVPVERNRRFPVPFCMPPDWEVVKVADETVVLTPSGMLPVLFAATDK